MNQKDVSQDKIASRPRIGLVEIPDAGIQTLSRLVRARSWDIALVVSLDGRSEAAQLAGRLRIPLLATPTRNALLTCDRIIIGDHSPVGIESIRALVMSSHVEVIPFEEAVSEKGKIATLSISVVSDSYAMQGSDPADDTIRSPRDTFDGRVLLGLGPATPATAVELEVQDPRIIGILEQVARLEGATTSSIMLVDADGEHLRVATAIGARAHEIRGLRLRPGEGIAGRAFVSGNPCSTQRPVAVMAESPDCASTRIALSVPITMAGRPIGILSVNTESAGEAEIEPLVRSLEQHAKEANRALLGAVRLDRADGERKELLRQLADRIMSLEETLPIRIGCIAGALGKAVHAGNSQLFLLDLQSNRFHKVNQESGLSIGRDASQPAHRGLLGWIIRNGKPRIAEMSDDETNDRIVVAYLPIRSFRSPALLVFEDCRIPHDQVQSEMELLTDVVHLVEEILSVEENVADQDFVSELEMRIADEAEDLDGLNPDERVQAILDLAVRLLAAEAAIWIPSPGGDPILAPLDVTLAGASTALTRERVAEAEAWIRRRGSVAGGSEELDARPGAPVSASPYAGAVSQDGTGVLIVYFSPDDTMGTFVQVAEVVLCQAIERLCERLAHKSGKPINLMSAPEFRPVLEPVAESPLRAVPKGEQQLQEDLETGQPFAAVPVEKESLSVERSAEEVQPVESEADEPFPVEPHSEGLLSVQPGAAEPFPFEPYSSEPLPMEPDAEQATEPTILRGGPHVEPSGDDAESPEETSTPVGGFAGIASLDTKILIIGSGEVRVGVLWEIVERIGTVSMRTGPGSDRSQAPAQPVSLGAFLNVTSSTEKHVVVLQEGGDTVALSCEHIGGLVPFASKDAGQTPAIRVVHATDLRRFLDQGNASQGEEARRNLPSPLKLQSLASSISPDATMENETGDSDDTLRRAG